MPDRSFLKAMFESGAPSFSWEFTVYWVSEQVAGFSKGLITSGELIRAVQEVDHSCRDYRLGRNYGLTHEQVSDILRRQAAGDPVGSDSPTGEGTTPR